MWHVCVCVFLPLNTYNLHPLHVRLRTVAVKKSNIYSIELIWISLHFVYYNWIPLVVLSNIFLGLLDRKNHKRQKPDPIFILYQCQWHTDIHLETLAFLTCRKRREEIVSDTDFNRNFTLLDKEMVLLLLLESTLLIKLIKYQMVHFTIVYLNSFMSTFHYFLTCIVTLHIYTHRDKHIRYECWSKWQNFSNESVNNLCWYVFVCDIVRVK